MQKITAYGAKTCPYCNVLNERQQHDKVNGQQLYQCPECGLHYKDKQMAEQCTAWCGKHKSCSLDIARLSEEVQAQQ